MTSRGIIIFSLACALTLGVESAPAACVWKVTGSNGATLYLGGSIHGLRSTDYPLPPEYNRAFEATSALVLEESLDVSSSDAQRFYNSGLYPKSDSLKNHVDPRTYDYLRRVFTLAQVPEDKWSKCKPWLLTTMIFAQATNPLGVDFYLLRRALANHKPVLGLESFRQHAEILKGMTDQQEELVLLENLCRQPKVEFHATKP